MEGLLGAGGFRARPILPAAAVVPATRAELISVPGRDSIMGTLVLLSTGSDAANRCAIFSAKIVQRLAASLPVPATWSRRVEF